MKLSKFWSKMKMYNSIEEYCFLKGIKNNFEVISDEDKTQFLNDISTLKEQLWQEHVKKLPIEEFNSLNDGTHPSISLNNEKALVYLESFNKKFGHFNFIRETGITLYHGSRFVISVKVATELPLHIIRKDIPSFYLGFSVLIAK